MDDFEPIDTMCEVVMEEDNDDSQVNIPGNFELPPVPTFDLQYEQFTYNLPPNVAQVPVAPPLVPIPTLYATPYPKIVPKPTKELLKIPITSKKEVSNENKITEKAQFISKIFNPALFGKVITSPDQYPKNLTNISVDEDKFFKQHFSDLTKVGLCRLHCTTCDKHLGCGPLAAESARRHRMLMVLVCKDCFIYYGEGVFPKDVTDNTEVFCFWCAQGGDLVCCSFCPKVFCYKCVQRNYDGPYLKKIQEVDEWACFCCAQTPLWPLRAVCTALLNYLRTAKGVVVDTTTCCGKKGRPRKILPQPTTAPTPRLLKPMVIFQNMSLNLPQQMPTTSKTRRSQLPAPRLPPPPPPKTTPAILRRRQPPPSTGPPPLVLGRIGQPLSRVRNQEVPARMPDVYVDHSIQETMVVRMRIPQNKDQYVRVNVTGACMRTPNFPTNASFHVQSMKHAFRANRMGHKHLMKLKKKMDDKVPEIEVAESLLSVLGKWKKVIGLVEDDLKHNLDIQKRKLQDIIDIDDEDREMKFTFESESRDVFDDDSDVEIIECDEVVPPPKRSKLNESAEKPGQQNGEANGEAEVDPLATEGVTEARANETTINSELDVKDNDKPAELNNKDEETSSAVNPEAHVTNSTTEEESEQETAAAESAKNSTAGAGVEKSAEEAENSLTEDDAENSLADEEVENATLGEEESDFEKAAKFVDSEIAKGHDDSGQNNEVEESENVLQNSGENDDKDESKKVVEDSGENEIHKSEKVKENSGENDEKDERSETIETLVEGGQGTENTPMEVDCNDGRRLEDSEADLFTLFEGELEKLEKEKTTDQDTSIDAIDEDALLNS